MTPRLRLFAVVMGVAGLLNTAGPAGAAFSDLGAGARAPGMGDAFVPVADDVYALYYNPAGLGLLRRPELGAAYSQLFWGLSDGSNLSTSFVGYAHPIAEGNHGTVAGAWNTFSLDTNLYREDAFSLSYGRLWLGRPETAELYAGTSLKYLRSSFGSFAEAENGTDGIQKSGRSDPVLTGPSRHEAFDADLGLLCRFRKHYAVGFSAQHLTQPDMAFSSGDTDRLPLALKAGLAYRSLVSNLVVQADTRRAPDGSQDRTFTAAAERWFPRLLVGEFGMRGALSLGSREYKQLTAGLSYRTRRLEISYGFAMPIQTVRSTAGTHRFAINFRFGRPSDDEESLEIVLEAMRQLKEQARVQALKDRAEGLTAGQRRVYEEYAAQSRFHLSQGRYQESQRQLSLALTVGPPGEELIARFGRLNMAVEHFARLPRYQEDPAEAATHQGILAYVEDRGLEAVQKLSLALALGPADPGVERLLAAIEGATGLRRVQGITVTPKSLIIDAKLTQAEAALSEGRHGDAVDLSLEVLREDDTRPRAWQNLGTAYFALKDFDSSLRAWRQALRHEKSPAIREAIRGYLKSLERLRRREPAKTVSPVRPIPERVRLSEREVSELFNRGIDAYTRREFNRAAEAFRTILEARPNHEEALKALHRVQEELR